MKRDIHPELHTISAQCTCGHAIDTESTRSEIKVTLCSNCHPFYTGAQRFVDTAGRIEKFEKKYKNFKKS
jgi:large subunit ribosomal protein L31